MRFSSILLTAIIAAVSSAAARTVAAQDTTRAPRPDTATVDSSTATPTARATVKKPAATRPPRPAPVWPVKGPMPLPGSILPHSRIVAFYGNPLSKRMGILGALPPERMLAKLDTVVAEWRAADSLTVVQPALHFIA